MKGSRLRQDDCSEGQNGYGDKRDSECLEPGHVEFCLSDVRAGAVWPLPSGIGRSHARLILFREYLGDVANF